jgi:hypothetical protein
MKRAMFRDLQAREASVEERGHAPRPGTLSSSKEVSRNHVAVQHAAVVVARDCADTA